MTSEEMAYERQQFTNHHIVFNTTWTMLTTWCMLMLFVLVIGLSGVQFGLQLYE